MSTWKLVWLLVFIAVVLTLTALHVMPMWLGLLILAGLAIGMGVGLRARGDRHK